MSAVNGVDSGHAAQQATTIGSSQQVSKDEFLKLFVAQLQNQDPMNPIDNEQFLAQLASFSSLEQLMAINEGVAALTSQIETYTAAQMESSSTTADAAEA